MVNRILCLGRKAEGVGPGPYVGLPMVWAKVPQ